MNNITGVTYVANTIYAIVEDMPIGEHADGSWNEGHPFTLVIWIDGKVDDCIGFMTFSDAWDGAFRAFAML